MIVPKLVQMIVTIYRVQGYKVPMANPRWTRKIQDGRYEIQFFTLSPYDFWKVIGVKEQNNLFGIP